jgi:hypothetical protein
LWTDFLITTTAGKETIKLEVLSETLKVLLSPFMHQAEKTQLLLTIQQLFIQEGNLLGD